MKSEIILIQITTIGLTVFFILLMWLESKRLKNMITPFIFAAIPLLVIFILNNFVLIYFQFPPISLKSQLFIALCLFITFLVGFFLSKLFRQITPVSNKIFTNFGNEFSKFDPLIIFIAWGIIFVILHRSFSLMRQHGGFAYFGNQEYEDKMIVGFVAHLVQFGKVLFLFLIFTISKTKYKKLSVITLVGLGIAIASIQVKYHIMFIILMAFLFYTFAKPVKKQIKILGISGLILFLLMNVFWIALTLAWGTFGFAKTGVWEFLLKQTLNYFVTGPIVLNTWLMHPGVKPDWTLLVVFINFYYFITGSFLRINTIPLLNLYFQQTAPGLYSNVGTAYGVYYLIGGMPFTVFMVIIVSLISYLFYFLALKKYNSYFMFLTLLFVTLNLLSFFGQYFTFLSIYEMTFLFFAMIIFFKSINYLNSLINKNIEKNYEGNK